MGLRDLVLLTVIYGSIPFILRKPFIGVLMWYWIGLMNPHRISWTLVNQPLALVIGVVMLFAILISRKEQKSIPVTRVTMILLVFWVWMLITTMFSYYPQLAWGQLEKVSKIMLTTYVAIMLLNSKERIIALVFVIAMSIGFYGFKGGLFTILNGGSSRVWGPPGSFIGDNNSIGLAIIMVIPLLFFMRTIARFAVLRMALLAGIVLSAFAVFGTFSRGALLGISAMATYMALKSRNKVQYILLIIVLAPVLWQFMPDSWHDRMGTIEHTEGDGSAQGRLKAWHMAFNLALNRVTGGGFETFKPDVYLMYLPEVGPRKTDAHSIYFEILGEQGFIGLGLYLGLLWGIFGGCRKIIASARGRPDLSWMQDLAAMLQVSLVGYMVSGAFLGLAYFDLFYALLAVVVGLGVLLKAELARGPLTPPVVAAEPIPVRRPYSPARRAPGKPKLRFAPGAREAWGMMRDWYRRL